VLLGAAMLGAVAGGLHRDVQTAMSGMSHVGRTYAPVQGALADLHASRYRAFQQLQAVGREIR